MNPMTAKAEMLIRRPKHEVFDAFVNPQTLVKFWLDAASGPLAPGAQVEWEFMVPGAKETVVVTNFRQDEHLGFDWSDAVHVDLELAEPSPGTTRLAVRASGFRGADPVAQVVGATEGFSIVLCDLKTLLETGSSAHLVRDKAELIATSK